MLQSTIDHATERIIAHGPARRTYAYQSPQTQSSPPNPFPQQTRSTNTRNKLTQPVVLFYLTEGFKKHNRKRNAEAKRTKTGGTPLALAAAVAEG
jgi:hypothetical protein